MDIKKRTLTVNEEACLNNDLLDIQEWVDNAITGKIGNCRTRMCEEWRPKLYADESVTQIPNDDDELVSIIIAREDYKNRAEREAKE